LRILKGAYQEEKDEFLLVTEEEDEWMNNT
jgi:hypothetical protein